MNFPIREILRWLVEHKVIKSWSKVNDSDKQYLIDFF